jgi:nicotinate-nucleotide adenylyltransferase
MRIGICGGTFDPFHCGHLDPILAARGRVQWDRVIYIPAFMQPFKQDRRTVSGYHRFAMTALAIADHDGLVADPRELERGSISYSVDTLRELRAEYPQAAFDWIIGDDNLEKLLDWKSIDEIFELANFVVLTRGAVPGIPAALRSRAGKFVFADNPTIPISSTAIRGRLAAGEPVDDLVPPRVSRYIQQNGLYRKAET